MTEDTRRYAIRRVNPETNEPAPWVALMVGVGGAIKLGEVGKEFEGTPLTEVEAARVFDFVVTKGFELGAVNGDEIELVEVITRPELVITQHDRLVTDVCK